MCEQTEETVICYTCTSVLWLHYNVNNEPRNFIVLNFFAHLLHEAGSFCNVLRVFARICNLVRDQDSTFKTQILKNTEIKCKQRQFLY